MGITWRRSDPLAPRTIRGVSSRVTIYHILLQRTQQVEVTFEVSESEDPESVALLLVGEHGWETVDRTALSVREIRD